MCVRQPGKAFLCLGTCLPAWHHSGAFEPPQLLWAAFDAFLAGTGVFSGGCQYTCSVCGVTRRTVRKGDNRSVCGVTPSDILWGRCVCAWCGCAAVRARRAACELVLCGRSSVDAGLRLVTVVPLTQSGSVQLRVGCKAAAACWPLSAAVV